MNDNQTNVKENDQAKCTQNEDGGLVALAHDVPGFVDGGYLGELEDFVVQVCGGHDTQTSDQNQSTLYKINTPRQLHIDQWHIRDNLQ